VSTDNPPTGAGEDGVPVVACAVGNAVAALTGVRLRELPFAPEAPSMPGANRLAAALYSAAPY
jgi:isoquinoline 1-oxidoreductase subunit beta